MKEKIAIIGTGISGMGAAYGLKDDYDIVFYEQNNYPGGHTNTLTLDEDGSFVFIDSAFMVYNEITYPNLTRLFSELGVETKNTDMSFSVQHKASGLEYCGTGLNGLFAQRSNIFSIKHWKLLFEMNRFNKESLEVLDNDQYADYTLARYIKEKNYSEDFLYKFLVPISSAVWSTPVDLMLKFPAVTLVRFFKNHGFLGLRGHYQWKTVQEGSQRYRDKILSFFPGKVMLECSAVSVLRKKHYVTVADSLGNQNRYDKVIIAAHADQALDILANPTEKEKSFLSKFPYCNNKVTLHTDETIMPSFKKAWSSWNYRIGTGAPVTIYWMNNLQGVSDRKNYFISVNDDGSVDRSKVLWEKEYSHPLFTVEGIRVQNRLEELNKEGPVYFCGAYFKYGFHEDGLTSGLNAVKAITGKQLWD